MEIRHSKTITAGCNQIKNQIDDVIKQNARIVEKELQKKILLLEFYHKELLSRKEKLTSHVAHLVTVNERIQHSIDSLTYPKEMCTQCLEIREIIPELQNDPVKRELIQEIDNIECAKLHFRALFDKLKEQIRKHKATIYALENDVHRKSNTLKIEKNNKTIKTTDMGINLNNLRKENMSFISKNTQYLDWEEDSKQLLQDADVQYDAGLRLQLHAEEFLQLKINSLITQYTSCNEAFNKRLVVYKNEKGELETKCSQVNEEIRQQKLNIRNIEDMMIENESHIKVAEIRLNNRAESEYLELSKDNVEVALVNELRRLNSVRNHLHNRWSQALSTLTSLNETKKRLEVEIQAKVDVIKVDEVECLPLRSSIHYHHY